jgi:hypothetical protein
MREVDEQGNVWEVQGSVSLLVEPTPEWIAANQPTIEPKLPQPTQEDYLIDLDYRLCMIELGL